MLEELGGGGGAQGVRDGEAHKGVAGGGVYVERGGDGGEVGGGEVEGVELGGNVSRWERLWMKTGKGKVPRHCVFADQGVIGMLRSGRSWARGSWRRGLLRT